MEHLAPPPPPLLPGNPQYVILITRLHMEDNSSPMPKLQWGVLTPII